MTTLRVLGLPNIHGAAGSFPCIPVVGAIAAGKPFESYSDGFFLEKLRSPRPPFQEPQDFEGNSGGSFTRETAPQECSSHGNPTHETMDIAIDPRMFTEGGEIIALQIHGDSMVQAGILDGDYAIIRRQNTVEEGEIAAVIINGEGTLKRWRTSSCQGKKTVSLHPANEHFDPIEITEENAKEVLVFGKYVGLVRGNLRFA